MKVAAKGQRVRALEDRPLLWPEVQEYWDAFHDLHRSRDTGGMQATPLRVSDIIAYFDILGICEAEDREDFFRLVRALDDSWLTWMRTRRTPTTGAKGKDDPNANDQRGHRRPKGRSRR